MKTIATLIFVLFIGVNLQAKSTSHKVQVYRVELIPTSASSTQSSLEVEVNCAMEVARLYKRTNTRVKKELTFSTKANRAKTA